MNKWLSGKIYAFAGTGVPGYYGNGREATAAKINGPAGLAVDNVNNVYIAEALNHVIRKVDGATHIISTIAGNGEPGFDGDGGLATSAKLNSPEGVFVDGQGNIYIADTYNHRIRKVDPETGIICTIAGNGTAGYSGDGGNARNASLNRPSGVVVDSIGNVFFNDYGNDRIRKINRHGIISTYAGTEEFGFRGDGGPADQARVNDVYGLAIDKKDNLYLIDSLNFAVRKVSAVTGIISTVIGQGIPGKIIENEGIADAFLGGIAHQKGTTGGEVPHALEVDRYGNIVIADTGINRIRMIDFKENRIFTVAGTGERGYSGDGGPALNAKLCAHGLRSDPKGNLYLADFHHHMVRVIKFDTPCN